MKRLTIHELKMHRTWLSQWRGPLEMAKYVYDLNVEIGSNTFFNQAGLQFFRDAFLAAEFGQLNGCDCVRLVKQTEEWPDFEANKDGRVERVECVELDLPERRRGDEYRTAAAAFERGESGIEQDPEEEWIARAEQIPGALAKAATTKAGKLYGERCSLLIYLNISEWGIRRAEIEAAIEQSISPALGAFGRVWVLWKDRLHGPFQSQSSR